MAGQINRENFSENVAHHFLTIFRDPRFDKQQLTVILRPYLQYSGEKYRSRERALEVIRHVLGDETAPNTTEVHAYIANCFETADHELLFYRLVLADFTDYHDAEECEERDRLLIQGLLRALTMIIDLINQQIRKRVDLGLPLPDTMVPQGEEDLGAPLSSIDDQMVPDVRVDVLAGVDAAAVDELVELESRIPHVPEYDVPTVSTVPDALDEQSRSLHLVAGVVYGREPDSPSDPEDDDVPTVPNL